MTRKDSTGTQSCTTATLTNGSHMTVFAMTKSTQQQKEELHELTKDDQQKATAVLTVEKKEKATEEPKEDVMDANEEPENPEDNMEGVIWLGEAKTEKRPPESHSKNTHNTSTTPLTTQALESLNGNSNKRPGEEEARSAGSRGSSVRSSGWKRNADEMEEGAVQLQKKKEQPPKKKKVSAIAETEAVATATALQTTGATTTSTTTTGSTITTATLLRTGRTASFLPPRISKQRVGSTRREYGNIHYRDN